MIIVEIIKADVSLVKDTSAIRRFLKDVIVFLGWGLPRFKLVKK